MDTAKSSTELPTVTPQLLTTIEDYYDNVTWWIPLIISFVVGGILLLITATMVKTNLIFPILIGLFIAQGALASYVAMRLNKKYGAVINWSRSPRTVGQFKKITGGLNRIQMFMQPGVPIYMMMKLMKMP